MEKIKIISQNFRRKRLKNSEAQTLLDTCDVLLAQEMYLPQDSRERETEIQNFSKSEKCVIYQSSEVKGGYTLIIIKEKHKANILKFNELIKGRAIQIKIKNDDYEQNIINVYAPQRDFHEHIAFCKELFQKLKNAKNTIIMGDWNNILTDDMCNKKRKYEHQRKSNNIKHLFENWIDIHNNYTNKVKYTYTQGEYRARLDRIYTNKENTQAIVKYEIIPATFSDHDTVVIDIKWGKRPIWGKGSWKMNTSILKDTEYRKRILKDIQNYNENKIIQDSMDAWDIFKSKIKQTTIAYSIEKQKKETNDLEILKQQLLDTIEIIDNSTKVDENMLNTKVDLEQHIQKLESEKSEGERIRAKIEKTNFDERSTKYYFKKEKELGNTKQIIAVDINEHQTAETKEEILEEIYKFYTTLYTSEGTNDQQIEENLKYINKKITEQDQSDLNKVVTSKEIHKAITDMKNEKSPGEDGIPKEFYLAFYDDLEEILIELYNNIKFSKRQPKSHKNAIIKLIYKKNNQKDLKNWRPISLLNVDYKILTKILTNRITEVTEKIVPIEQKCGVKNRKMSEIIRNIASFRKYSEQGYLVLIDQIKAFDRVNHKYLFKTMEKLGITGDFLEMTKMLYTDITSKVEVNGAKTKPINIDRGVRQGCPYSMILFVLATIPLIEKIKQSKKIQGYKTKLNNTIKIQCYADDITIIIQNPKEIYEVYKIFNEHGAASESRINDEKTQIFRLHQKRPNHEPPEIKDKIKTEVTILGTILSEQKENETKLNLQKAITTLKKWNEKYNDHISLVGKILNINTYIYSTIYNSAWVLDTEDLAFRQLIYEASLYLQKVKHQDTYDKVAKRIEEGGLGLINIKERVETIKAIEILQAIDKMPETDNIIYETSINQIKLYQKIVPGPKMQTPPAETTKLIKIIEPKIEIIRNYKKRHKSISTKTVHSILFGVEKETNYKEIIMAKEPKLISINYKVKNNLLPTQNFRNCQFCDSHRETTQHLMVECVFFEPLRRQANMFLEPLRKPKLTKDSIINMININDELENQIISRYKYTIWQTRNNRQKINIENIKQIFDKEIRFYIKYIRITN
jgi:hypothetical protein